MTSKAHKAWTMVKGAASKVQGAASTLQGVASKVKSVTSVVKPRETVTSVVARYQAFTGVLEIKACQQNVIAVQNKFIAAQEKRRDAGDKLLSHQSRLRAIHEEMQSITKGDPNYLKLITEEHNIIVEENNLRNEFQNIEREERDYFTEMTAAVKLSHETERFYAEKNKYLYLIASIVGTVLGVLGSSINNYMKMKELKEMMTEEKSGSKIWNLKFSEGTTEKKLKDLESRVIAISTNQKTIIDYIIKIETMIERQFGNTKHLIQTSLAQSDKKQQSHDESQPISQPLLNQVSQEDVKSSVFYGVLIIAGCIILGKVFS